ncbi:hypothetical protein [Rhizobium sp. KDH_Rht_773_N]
MKDFTSYSTDSIIASARTYSKVISMIQNAWDECFTEKLEIKGDSPTGRFNYLLEKLKERFKDPESKRKIEYALDVDHLESPDEIVTILTGKEGILRNVDDLTANQILTSISNVAFDMADRQQPNDVELVIFLRGVIRDIFEKNSLVGRINIGANRHFPRLFQWLTEFENNTDWGTNKGFHIKNISGRGRVKRMPTDPRTLKVTLDIRYL